MGPNLPDAIDRDQTRRVRLVGPKDEREKSMEVVLQELTKHFGQKPAVNRINVSIKDGEFLSIVGPSGCGKTTTLRLIAGFIKPDYGRVIFNGEVVDDLPPRKRDVGIVFQNYALFPNMSVSNNIAFGLRARKIPEREVIQKVEELIELVKLTGKENDYPKQLSGGQQQRVALARALAISPKILLLDEPLSALDAKVRLMLRYEVKRIQQQSGITTIYVTHDQEEALSISDRVVVMDQGIILQVGSPEAIYQNPENEFVASFIGISNMLKGASMLGNSGEATWGGRALKVPFLSKRTGNVTLLVRPEKIRLFKELPRGESVPQEMNFLPGRIEGKVFLGSLVRVAVEVHNQTVLVDVSQFGKINMKGGDQVYLGFSREDVLVL